ncbi:MAG: type II toxin-antitoxin system Phd/YefM family antitoxin [Terriglobales bacterium]
MDLVYCFDIMEVNIHEAKTHLSRLLQRVAAGEEITIARAGVPVARLVAAGPQSKSRPMGMDEGKIWIAEDFDAPDPAMEALFYDAPLTSAPPRKTKKKKR